MQTGTPAPSFVAYAYIPYTKERVKVNMDDFIGQYTVLIFYPGDFGPLVLAELMGFQEAAKELLENVYSLAISTDTLESHKAFAELKKEEGGLQGLNENIILVEDKTGDISRKYQVYDVATHQAFPTYIIICDEGKVVASITNDHNMGGNPHEVIRILNACMTCDKEEAWTQMKGTPSGWQPGMELVTGVMEEENDAADVNEEKQDNTS